MNTTTQAQAETVTVQMVDAREVVIDANVRTNVKLDRSFVSSIRRHGVILPILAHPTEDGKIKVEDGQRRILGAIDAERYPVPAYIVPEHDTDAKRIVRQLIANEHRAELDEAERVAAWKQLELEGMSVTAIARAVAEKPKRVKAGLAVAGSEAATKEVTEHQVTLDQALVIAEFEDDPEVADRLRSIASHSPEQFEHEAQRFRDRRTERAEMEALIADYTERGYQQIDWPAYDDKATLPLRDLTYPDGTALTEDNYLGGNGYRFAVRAGWNGIQVGHFVTDWRKWGLKKRKADGTPSLPMSDEDKAERRRVIENNKAWRSAETVRRTWLRNFLARKTAPKGAQQFIAKTVIDGRGGIERAMQEHHPLAADLLELPAHQFGKPHPLLTHIEKQPGRITMVMLAVARAAHDATTGPHTWRNPSRDMADYFTALADWGYALSDVENLVRGIEPDTDAEPENPSDPEPETETEAEDSDEDEQADPDAPDPDDTDPESAEPDETEAATEKADDTEPEPEPEGETPQDGDEADPVSEREIVAEAA